MNQEEMILLGNYSQIDENPQPGYFIITREGDVTGDGISDLVFLLASRPDPDSPFLDNFVPGVESGTGEGTIQVPLAAVGYDPTLFLGDFTGDAVLEALVKINSGGSAGLIFAYLYSFLNNEPRLLFDAESFSSRSLFEVIYRDDYRVDVIDEETGNVFTIDISRRDPEYLNEIYDTEGNLLAPVEGTVLPLGDLLVIAGNQLIATPPSDVLQLLAIQRIIGRFNADTLGFVNTLLRWNGSEFIRQDVRVCILPANA